MTKYWRTVRFQTGPRSARPFTFLLREQLPRMHYEQCMLSHCFHPNSTYPKRVTAESFNKHLLLFCSDCSQLLAEASTRPRGANSTYCRQRWWPFRNAHSSFLQHFLRYIYDCFAPCKSDLTVWMKDQVAVEHQVFWQCWLCLCPYPFAVQGKTSFMNLV